ncbi:Protein DCL, chloroplastic [Apostasia shenzhenica]|uniref:Protein DCL, chloroplastic n=1 Tax=Apostasia shenzhenica TaxID=1088818 RepID=A0A2I0B8E7_9ASPA|nr:Protein DCL, chloroplastic [Apostasia shenzhenica]
MAEEATETARSVAGERPELEEVMDLEAGITDDSISAGPGEDHHGGEEKASENGGSKRGREEIDGDEAEGAAKKPMVERSAEEERLEKFEDMACEEDEEVARAESVEGKDGKELVSVQLGPKIFCSSVEMFDYFYKLLHHWPPNLNINKYEQMVLLDLLKRGHSDSAKKIGEGIKAFQVRYHPMFKSKCFFLLRVDGSEDDFSFRKCVDHLIPLPANMKPATTSNGMKASRHQKGSGGRGRGHGRGGRGGRGRGNRGR